MSRDGFEAALDRFEAIRAERDEAFRLLNDARAARDAALARAESAEKANESEARKTKAALHQLKLASAERDKAISERDALFKAVHEMAGLISTSPNYSDKHPSAVLRDFGVMDLCQAIARTPSAEQEGR